MIIPIRAGVGYGFGVPMLLLLGVLCTGIAADVAYRANAIHPGERRIEQDITDNIEFICLG